jgi:cytochrome b subunit of formate dehydrogenase
MRQAPKTVEVLDPIDLIIHGLAAVGVVGALATGPLLRFPQTSQLLVGDGFNVAFLHTTFAGLALMAWLGHIARVCLGWLEGGYVFSLLPRVSDLGQLTKGILWNLGSSQRPERGRYDYRERFAYFVQVCALPLLIVTGFALSNPAQPAAVFGPAMLVRAAGFHVAVGYVVAAFLALHLYFSLCAPGALFGNTSFLTGRADWERVQMMRPGWAQELLDATSAQEASVDESPPSVADLLARGNDAAREGDLEGARGYFEEALTLFPGYTQALFNLAVVLSRLGEKDQAALRLREYLKEDAFGSAADRARKLLAELEEVSV